MMNPRLKKIVLYVALTAAAVYLLLLILARTGALAKIILALRGGADPDTDTSAPATAVANVAASDTASSEWPLRMNLSRKSDNVRKLQEVLRNQRLLQQSDVDGYWGPVTDAAVLTLRRSHLPNSSEQPLIGYIQIDRYGAYIAKPSDLSAIIRWNNAHVNPLTKLVAS